MTPHKQTTSAAPQKKNYVIACCYEILTGCWESGGNLDHYWWVGSYMNSVCKRAEELYHFHYATVHKSDIA